MRVGSCARTRPTRSPPRVRSTPGWVSSGASGTRSSWPAAGPRKHLTLVHKTNVLTFAGDLWERTFDEVAAELPRRRDRLQPHRRRLHPLRRRPRPLRRHRHRQPLRRHPHRPGRRRRGRHRSGQLGQPQPRPHRARRCSSPCTARPPTSPGQGIANPTAAVLSACDDVATSSVRPTPPAGSPRRCADPEIAHRHHRRDRRSHRRPRSEPARPRTHAHLKEDPCPSKPPTRSG